MKIKLTEMSVLSTGRCILANREKNKNPSYFNLKTTTLNIKFIDISLTFKILFQLDFVQRPSWQAQISGTKTWSLIPSPECEGICHSVNVTVETGDIGRSNVWMLIIFSNM